MKKLLLSTIFVAAMVFSIASFGQAKWTFMVYLDSDCDLESYGIADFLEMATVGSTNDVNIVVQMDRVPGYSTEYEDWTTTKRFLISKDMTPVEANQLSDLGELNMGDPATLKDFIKWGVATYPADNYAVILWNHGDGWRTRDISNGKRKGVCYDETSNNDFLTTAELKEAMSDTGINISVVGFDACLMGMLEVAYELRNNASVMVSSEEVEPGDGWPYDTICSWLVSNSDATASSFGSKIVDLYYASYSGAGGDVTQSALDLSQVGTLATLLGTFATTVNTDSTAQATIKPTAQAVMTQITENVVINSKAGGSVEESYGVAINFPTNGPDSDYTSDNLSFLTDIPSWSTFLTNYSTTYSLAWIGTARKDTLAYYDENFVDLYDFCDNLKNGGGGGASYDSVLVYKEKYDYLNGGPKNKNKLEIYVVVQFNSQKGTFGAAKQITVDKKAKTFSSGDSLLTFTKDKTNTLATYFDGESTAYLYYGTKMKEEDIGLEEKVSVSSSMAGVQCSYSSCTTWTCSTKIKIKLDKKFTKGENEQTSPSVTNAISTISAYLQGKGYANK